MKTTPVQGALAAVVLLSTLNPRLSPVLAQGSLTPPGAPAPTMRTLAQIEPRTPILDAPFIITNAGSYYLTTNLTVTSGDAITIATNGVTLDLSGFTIFSTAASATGSGILLRGVCSDITIFNGHSRGGVTNNAGTYNGPGFGYGISYSDAAPVNVRVAGVSVSGCLYDGINLGNEDSTVVESCTVRTAGSSGIVASTIKGSVVVDCAGYAIYGRQVSDSRGESTGSGTGLDAVAAQNCYGSCSGGYGLAAGTALNCFGYSSSGYGLAADTAQNCYGQSNSGTALYAFRSAQNCFGVSYGSSSSLYAEHTAQNCCGYNGSTGTGLSTHIAIGCRGNSSSGTGLSAYIANSCSGSSVSATYKYNMP